MSVPLQTLRAYPPKGMLCSGVLLFGYFLLHEQEKVTRSPDASGNAQDASTNLTYFPQPE